MESKIFGSNGNFLCFENDIDLQHKYVLFVVIVHRASSLSSLKYLNDTDKYPIF